MAHTLEEVRGYALQLTSDERGLLADELHESVLTDEERQFDDEYAVELKRRIAEIDNGTAKLVSSEQAIASAQKAVDDVRRTARRR
jgi:Putative addiction module component